MSRDEFLENCSPAERAAFRELSWADGPEPAVRGILAAARNGLGVD